MVVATASPITAMTGVVPILIDTATERGLRLVIAPIVVTLLLHLVHLVKLPIFSSAVQYHVHHHSMHGDMENGAGLWLNWYDIVSAEINVLGIVFAGRLLWLTRKVSEPDVKTYVCLESQTKTLEKRN